MKWTEHNRAAGVGVCRVCVCVSELLYMKSQMKLCPALQHRGRWEWVSGDERRGNEPADQKERRGACSGRNDFQPLATRLYVFIRGFYLFMSHPHTQASNTSSPPLRALHPRPSSPELLSHVSGLFCQRLTTVDPALMQQADCMFSALQGVF